jgi:aconitate hydratase
LLGVRVVLAESYERIHRSNLVGMGVLPLQYADGASAASIGLDGTETFAVRGPASGIEPGQRVEVQAVKGDGTPLTFQAILRIDGRAEVDYVKAGGVLSLVLGQMLASP